MVRAPPCHGGGRGFESLPGRLHRKMRDIIVPWDHSSAGRAPALQAGGHRFEPCWSHQPSSRLNAAVAELADALDLKSCGTYTPVPVRFRFAALKRLEYNLFLYVGVAQLDRAFGYGPKGREFESSHPRLRPLYLWI